MFSLNHRLRCGLLACLIFLAGAAAPARAQDVAAAPVVPVTGETLPAESLAFAQGPVIIELFSSQACVFCPRADRLFADLAQQENVIGLACHVDYFDVRKGSLAKPFCSARQNMYMKALRGGPNYTPQMVVQGRHDVVGYDIPAVTKALQQAAQDIPAPIAIAHEGTDGRYSVALPARAEAGEGAPLRLWLFAYDLPHDITVAEGRNRGQRVAYANIVSAVQDLGLWEGRAADTMAVEIKRAAGQRGFAVLAQDEATGRIAAAGRYEFGREKSTEKKPAFND